MKEASPAFYAFTYLSFENCPGFVFVVFSFIGDFLRLHSIFYSRQCIARLIVTSSSYCHYINVPTRDLRGIKWSFRAFCEHASAVFYFASTSNNRIYLENSEHCRRIQLASSELLEFYLELLGKFSATLLFIEC